MEDLGSKIKFYRKQKGLSQAELAQLCGLSHKNVIYSIERGATTPSLSKLLPKICDVLGLKLYIVLTPKEISQ